MHQTIVCDSIRSLRNDVRYGYGYGRDAQNTVRYGYGYGYERAYFTYMDLCPNQ